MGLGKKLGQMNASVNSQVANANAPLADNGFNAQNIPNLQTTAVTREDVTQINQLVGEARSDYIQIQQNQFNLQKPTVPQGNEYPNYDVSVLVVEKMWRIVCLKKLHGFYSQDSLQKLVNRACKHDYKTLMTNWSLPTLDMAVDLAVLGLYDIVIFGDDSGSMNSEEPKEDNLTRWELLKQVVKTIGFWATLMDSDGVVVRFINSMQEGDGISNSAKIDNMFRTVRPSGGTPLGEQLDAKIIRKIVIPVIQSQQIERPVLVLTVTDGEPSNRAAVKQTILNCRNFCAQTKYGENAVAFSFAQVGSDRNATSYLGELDTDPQVGHLIDCTSEFSIEKEECGAEFTEAVWVVKLLIGAVDPAYDQSDEQPQTGSYTQNMPMANPQGYPPQGYPPQGYPPQGYPPQKYQQSQTQGYPPQKYQQSQTQGYPPQGYPPQGYPQPQTQSHTGSYPQNMQTAYSWGYPQA